MENKAFLDQNQSDALRIAIFLATLLVVFRHGFNLHHYYSDGHPWMVVSDWNILMQRFISEFTALAIPLFFMISGFLFFLGLNDYKHIIKKWKRRINSLLIPFFCWNILTLLLCFSLFLCFPALHVQLQKTFGISFSVSWIIEQLTISPIVGQFWYIRTLILFILLSPFFLLIYRYQVFSVLILSLLMRYWIPVDCRLFSTEGLFCFFLGGLIGFNHWHTKIHLQKYYALLLPLIACFIFCDIFSVTKFPLWHIRIILSIIFFIQLSLYLASIPNISKKLCRLNHYSFVIYAIHGNIISAISLSISKILPHTPIYSAFSYFAALSATLVIAILFAEILKRFFPNIYPFLTGGRG